MGCVQLCSCSQSVPAFRWEGRLRGSVMCMSTVLLTVMLLVCDFCCLLRACVCLAWHCRQLHSAFLDQQASQRCGCCLRVVVGRQWSVAFRAGSCMECTHCNVPPATATARRPVHAAPSPLHASAVCFHRNRAFGSYFILHRTTALTPSLQHSFQHLFFSFFSQVYHGKQYENVHQHTNENVYDQDVEMTGFEAYHGKHVPVHHTIDEVHGLGGRFWWFVGFRVFRVLFVVVCWVPAAAAYNHVGCRRYVKYVFLSSCCSDGTAKVGMEAFGQMRLLWLMHVV